MINFKYQEWITREDVRSNPRNLYVFGDNLARQGFGGQAAAMRGEVNAIGIATKRLPSMDDRAFFADRVDELAAVYSDLSKLLYSYDKGDYEWIVWPTDRIGTGLAKLQEKSPVIMRIINDFEIWLYGVRE